MVISTLVELLQREWADREWLNFLIESLNTIFYNIINFNTHIYVSGLAGFAIILIQGIVVGKHFILLTKRKALGLALQLE